MRLKKKKLCKIKHNLMYYARKVQKGQEITLHVILDRVKDEYIAGEVYYLLQRTSAASDISPFSDDTNKIYKDEYTKNVVQEAREVYEEYRVSILSKYYKMLKDKWSYRANKFTVLSVVWGILLGLIGWITAYWSCIKAVVSSILLGIS